MGQFTLGLRSLLIKATVFVVMAALLAWALGGTLWPRPQIADFDSVVVAGRQWFWRLAVGGSNPGEVRWILMCQSPGERAKPFDDRHWRDVAGPIVVEEALYVAGRPTLNGNDLWRIERIADGVAYPSVMPDRLAVEQQLARLASGLPLQDAQTIRQERDLVLDPGGKKAEEISAAGQGH